MPAADIPCIVIIWISLPVTLLALSSGVLYFIDKRGKKRYIMPTECPKKLCVV